MSLQVEKLTGGYAVKPIIHDLSFTVGEGEVVALIGLNGAGKSTTIKHIIGLMTPLSGQIKLNNQTMAENTTAYLQAVSYIPETPMIYDELTLEEHLEFTRLNFPGDEQLMAAEGQRLVRLFHLEDKLNQFPRFFSKGMRQKVMLICALMLDTPLYVIDEPFVGLDPLAINDLVNLINEKKAQGKSILLSTHILAQAETLCDRFVLMHKGVIVAQGTLDAIRQEFDMPQADLTALYIKLMSEDQAND